MNTNPVGQTTDRRFDIYKILDPDEIPENAGTDFWIIFSDVGTPIITNGRTGKERVFIHCDDMNQADDLIEWLQGDRLLAEELDLTTIPTGPPAHGKRRIMYIERKAGSLIGVARIGLVFYSRSGRTLYYKGRAFQSLNGLGFKSNFREVATGEEYWISGCKQDGSDRLYGERIPVEIDEDVRQTYWLEIRKRPEWKDRRYSNT